MLALESTTSEARIGSIFGLFAFCHNFAPKRPQYVRESQSLGFADFSVIPLGARLPTCRAIQAQGSN
jgi:hypothetical protein